MTQTFKATWEKVINTGRYIPRPWKFTFIITVWIRRFACHHHILQNTVTVAMVRCQNTLQHLISNTLNTFLILRLKSPLWQDNFVYLASGVAWQEAARCSRNTRRCLNKEKQLDRWGKLIVSHRSVQWCFGQTFTQHKFPWTFPAQCFQKTRLSCHGRQLAHALAWPSSARLHLLRLRRKQCTQNTFQLAT